MEERKFVTLLMFIVGLIGVFLNGICTYHFIYPKPHSSFGILCATHTFANFIIMFNFLVWSCPVNYWELDWGVNRVGRAFGTIMWYAWFLSIYTQIFLAINRFLAINMPAFYHRIFTINNTQRIAIGIIIFSLWHFVFNQFDGCELLFYSDIYQWYFTENATCATIIIEYLELYYISIMFAFACLLDLCTLIALIKHFKVATRDRPFSSSDIRFFFQSCITGFVFVCVTFCFHLGYEFFDADDKLGLFLVSTFAWECTHTFDGLIIILFNKELRRLFSHPSHIFSSRNYSHNSAPQEHLDIKMGQMFIVASCIAIEALIGNLILIYVLFTSCPLMNRSHRSLLFAGSIVRILFAILCITTAPALYYIPEHEAVVSVQGLVMNKTIGKFLLSATTIVLSFYAIMPCLSFVHRYFYIVLNNNHSKGQRICAWSMALVPLIGTAIFSVNCCASFWPTVVEEEIFRNTIYPLNTEGDTAFLLISLKDYKTIAESAALISNSYWKIFTMVSVSSITILSILIMIYCLCRIQAVFSANWNHLSARTICMLRQIQITFLIQSLCSILFFIFPFSTCMVGPIFKVNPGTSLLSIASLMYLFSPAFCPWMMIFLVKEIRQSTWAIVQRRTSISKSLVEDISASKKQNTEQTAWNNTK